MNKGKLAETGILVIIIVLIYQLVNAIIQAISGIYFMTSNRFPASFRSFIIDLVLPVILYLCAIYLLHMYKRNLAKWLSGESEEDDTKPVLFPFTPAMIIHCAIFIICFNVLLTELPALLTQAFDTKSETGNETLGGFPGNGFPDPAEKIMTTTRIAGFIRLFLAVVFLAFSAARIFSSKPAKSAP